MISAENRAKNSKLTIKKIFYQGVALVLKAFSLKKTTRDIHRLRSNCLAQKKISWFEEIR
jgi:hypothetical protein